MKRLALTIGCLSILAVAAAVALVSFVPDVLWDARVTGPDGTAMRYWSTSRTPQDRATVLSKAFQSALPGFLIEINAGIYDFGQNANVTLPSCTIIGKGPGVTVLKGEVISDTLGSNFVLQNTTLKELSLINDCWYFAEDGRCVGFDDKSNCTASIIHCSLWCRDWTFYSWSGTGNTATLENCTITTGRVGVACENSGLGQDVTLRHCQINGDASLSNSRGATSDQNTGGVFGIICRGGLCRAYDVEFRGKGRPKADQDTNQSWTPRICAMTDHGGGGDPPAYGTQVEVYDLKSWITPNGSDPTQCFDLDLKYLGNADYQSKGATIRISNSCWGSAADGSLTKSW